MCVQLTKKFEAVDPGEHARIGEELAHAQGQLRQANEAASGSTAEVQAVRQEVAALQAQLEDLTTKKEEDLRRYRATLRVRPTTTRRQRKDGVVHNQGSTSSISTPPRISV